MPVYETIKEGHSHEPVFKSTVVVNNARYVSLPGFYNRKAAEQSAAEVALLALAKSNNSSSNGISQHVMEAGQIDIGCSVRIATGTTYTPPAPTTQEEIDLSRDLSRKMKVMGTNQESHGKNKPPSVSSCYVFKSQLLEYCQKTGLTTPVYETIKEGPSHEPVFKSTVVVNNARYVSLPGFHNRKASEQSAAEVALLALAKSNNSSSEISQLLHETSLCKNLLQDYAQKMNNVSPIYMCRWEEKEGKMPMFSCVVAIGSIKYTGASAGTKKEAEIKAARTALLAIQTAVPVTEDHTGNSIYTVIPQKRKGSDLAISIQETRESLKPKKGWVKKQYQKKWQPVKKDNPAGGTTRLEVNADGRTGVGSTVTVGQGGLQVDAADTVGSRGTTNGGSDMHQHEGRGCS
ncbi:double-stranded RNA-binding protein 1-like isoform X2 [Salvia splendens]|nr:double-stranded RNA-binding protein 1-like isoform X2 [Salvia splendens]